MTLFFRRNSRQKSISTRKSSWTCSSDFLKSLCSQETRSKIAPKYMSSLLSPSKSSQNPSQVYKISLKTKTSHQFNSLQVNTNLMTPGPKNSPRMAVALSLLEESFSVIFYASTKMYKRPTLAKIRRSSRTFGKNSCRFLKQWQTCSNSGQSISKRTCNIPT